MIGGGKENEKVINDNEVRQKERVLKYEGIIQTRGMDEEGVRPL